MLRLIRLRRPTTFVTPSIRFASNKKSPPGPKQGIIPPSLKKTISFSLKVVAGILLLDYLNKHWVSNNNLQREHAIINRSRERSTTARAIESPPTQIESIDRAQMVQGSGFSEHGRDRDGSHPEIRAKTAYYNDSSRHINNMEKTVVHMYDMQTAARLDQQHYDGKTTALAGPKRSRNTWEQLPESMRPKEIREQLYNKKRKEKQEAYLKYQKEKEEGKNPSLAHDRRMKRMDEKERRERFEKLEASKEGRMKKLKQDPGVVTHPKKLYT